ncbi:hypothetical protein Gotri_018672 [Gossypium trilobum]|uniref:RNase H type-1 domain-containing protein n=1 Tax=Gossypium trilobum TaxID=34281 RepID=A0A7J9EAE2_9ROSI|nr:hypothetical protein [Gossypium trilobum]
MLNRGFECILIQTNSFEAINDIQEEALGGSKSTLITRIHQLLSKVHHWSIQHIPRDENKIADGLVKMVHDKRTRLHILKDLT